MTLKYQFDIYAEVEQSSLEFYNRIDPPTKTELITVDYEYDVDISVEDLAEFLGVEPSETIGKFLDMFGASVEEDEDFIEFMTEKYEDDARRECEEEYE